MKARAASLQNPTITEHVLQLPDFRFSIACKLTLYCLQLYFLLPTRLLYRQMLMALRCKEALLVIWFRGVCTPSVTFDEHCGIG